MLVAIGLTVAALQAGPPPFAADTPPLEWITNNAPFGMDITFDGKVWVNTNPVGMTNDYAVLAADLYKVKIANSDYPEVWLRGYHAKNPKVAYRESKLLVAIDCRRDTYFLRKVVRYDSKGEVTESSGPFASEPIIPGSIAESWRAAICPS